MSGNAKLRRIGLAALAAKYPTDEAMIAAGAEPVLHVQRVLRAHLGLPEPEPFLARYLS